MAKRIRFTPRLAGGAFAAAVFLAGGPAAARDVPFAPLFVVATGATQAVSVVAADVDRDGDLDVVAASYGNDRIAWSENTAGDGSAWTTHTISQLANGPITVWAADVDRDGDPDVLAASQIDDSVRWFENAAGDGSLWTVHTIATDADGAQSVHAADVDRDGDTDVLSASSLDDTIAWYENLDGAGASWLARTIALDADAAQFVRAGDVDGDGDLDAVSASYQDDTVAWYENTAGDGTAWTARTISLTANGAYAVFLADVDGDGDLDVLSARNADDAVGWHENVLGDGTLWTQHTVTTTANGATAVFAADLDRDGDVDVLSTSAFDNKVAWYENEGGGAAFTLRTISTAQPAAFSVVAADVDGDGDDDVLSAALNGNRIALHENLTLHESACFAPPSALTTALAFPAFSVTAADVDGDGDGDAVVGSLVGSFVSWLENAAGDGSLWTLRTVATAGSGGGLVAVDDVDGDGAVDIWSAAVSASRIAWHRNASGDGTVWTSTPVSTALLLPFDVAGADIDGDGDRDVVSAFNQSDTFAWHENTAGDGTAWTTRPIATGADGAGSVFVADVDGDGDEDVLAAASDAGTLAWFERSGGGAWTRHTVTDTLPGASAVLALDVDRDGDQDVVGGAASVQDRVNWYENAAGDGSSWTVHEIVTAAGDASTLFAADLDRDGDGDVLVGAASQPLAWYENGGDGTSWTRRTLSTQEFGPVFVDAADLDGDGDLDVLSSTPDFGRLDWHPSEAGQFALTATDVAPATAENSAVVAMLRIDAAHLGRAGDGDLELASLGLRFEAAPGVPLTSTEANAIVESLRVYRDADGNGVFDPALDALVVSLPTLALTGGVQVVPFADGDAQVQVGAAASRTYFVVVELAALANQQDPNVFRVTHLGRGAFASAAEDRAFDIPLRPACAADVSSGFRQIVPVTLQGFTVE
jgi:FG-GAP-like repeat